MHYAPGTCCGTEIRPRSGRRQSGFMTPGYERHEILHMPGQPMSDQIWAALHEDRPNDRARRWRRCEPFRAAGNWSAPLDQRGKDTSRDADKFARTPARHAAATGAQIEKAPLCGAFHSAPERTRTSTDHSVH
jgi:hypothetical protein